MISISLVLLLYVPLQHELHNYGMRGLKKLTVTDEYLGNNMYAPFSLAEAGT